MLWVEAPRVAQVPQAALCPCGEVRGGVDPREVARGEDRVGVASAQGAGDRPGVEGVVTVVGGETSPG